MYTLQQYVGTSACVSPAFLPNIALQDRSFAEKTSQNPAGAPSQKDSLYMQCHVRKWAESM